MDGLPLWASALRSSTASESAPPFAIRSKSRTVTGFSHPTDTALPPIGVATPDGIAWLDVPVHKTTRQLHLRFFKKAPFSKDLHTDINPFQVTVTITLDPSHPDLVYGIICVNNPLIYVDPSGHNDLDKALGNAGDFLGDFLGGLVCAAVIVFCPECSPLVAGMLGGIAGGATNAAINGASLEGICEAATIGGVFGALGGGTYQVFGSDAVPYMIGGGATFATATGGVEGLAHYAAGFAGGWVGWKYTPYAWNLAEGYGFESNNRVVTELANKGEYQKAWDFARSRYGGIPRGIYDPGNEYFVKNPGKTAFTDSDGNTIFNERIFIGTKSGSVQGIGFHEGVHQKQLASGLWGNDRPGNVNALEVQAYDAIIWNRFRLDVDDMTLLRMRTYRRSYLP